MRRVQIELGPLTIAIGLFLRFEVSLNPLGVAIGPFAVMWTWHLQSWGVDFW